MKRLRPFRRLARPLQDNHGIALVGCVLHETGPTVGKDFRAGLIVGLIVAVIGLVWVATRPSLSPQARMLQRSANRSGLSLPSESVLPWAVVSPPPETNVPRDEPPTAPSETTTAELLPTVAPTEPQQPSAGPALPDLTIYERDEPIKTTRFHIVQRGESLSIIARQYYGSSNQWRKILAANEKAIKDANKIAPGTKLIIPD